MDCRFCDEFTRGFILVNDKNLGNRILFETENFLVFPSLGQIVEGYLLIATKKHFISFARIPSRWYKELELVKEKVREVLNEKYGKTIFFEHGPISEKKRAGCCIDHAHIHAVPVDVSVIEDLKMFDNERIDNFSSLKKLDRPYFFVEENGKKYVFILPDVVPSQYIRKLIAKKIGKIERADWREYLGLEELKKTYNKLVNGF